MKITYTAKRSLIAGHTFGEEYTLTFDILAFDPDYPVSKEESTTLNGTIEALLNRIEERWRVTAFAIEPANRAQWREFIDSVAAREPFVMEEDAMEVTATLDGEPRYTRISTTAAFNIAFTVLVSNA